MNRKNQKLKRVLLSLATIFIFSCTSYLENPLIDKKTGEDIDLLVIDASVFPIRLGISLIDSLSGSAINSRATISFSGKNQNDIITFAGKKQPEFHTSTGFIELAVDPNLTVSETEPLTFTIHVTAPMYPEITRKFIFENAGVKEIEILLQNPL